MSSPQGTQADDPKEMIQFHRKKILTAEAAVLKDPGEENLTRLTDVLEESRRFREGLHG